MLCVALRAECTKWSGFYRALTIVHCSYRNWSFGVTLLFCFLQTYLCFSHDSDFACLKTYHTSNSNNSFFIQINISRIIMVIVATAYKPIIHVTLLFCYLQTYLCFSYGAGLVCLKTYYQSQQQSWYTNKSFPDTELIVIIVAATNKSIIRSRIIILLPANLFMLFLQCWPCLFEIIPLYQFQQLSYAFLMLLAWLL